MEKNAKIQQTNRATKRKQLVGVVISTKNHKTIGVNVDNYQKHPLYSKRIKVSKKFNVHDEQEVSKVGDIVRIAETRPLSKTKSFRLVEVVKKEGQ